MDRPRRRRAAAGGMRETPLSLHLRPICVNLRIKLPRLKHYIALARPFTLLPPLLGIVSGAVCAWGSAHNPDPARALTSSVIWTIVLGSLCASFLNAANNSLNQIYDLEIDRINKPKRPLVTGEVSIRRRLDLHLDHVRPRPRADVARGRLSVHDAGARSSSRRCRGTSASPSTSSRFISTFVYSVPALGRTKAHPIGANLTIAIPRGCLLKVAGWTMVAHATTAEPWFIGSVFMLFLLGAASTKDFSDIEGDRAGGCRTLPIAFGVKRAAWMIAPFFIFPWLLMPLGARHAHPHRQRHVPDDPRHRPRALGRVHGLADRPQSRRADGDGEPSVVAAHVPDDDGRAGGLRGGVCGSASKSFILRSAAHVRICGGCRAD